MRMIRILWFTAFVNGGLTLDYALATIVVIDSPFLGFGYLLL